MNTEHKECEEAVIEKIRARRDRGRTKYGKTMEREDLTVIEWFQHAQEEAMDLAIYLERCIRDIKERDDRLLKMQRDTEWGNTPL